MTQDVTLTIRAVDGTSPAYQQVSRHNQQLQADLQRLKTAAGDSGKAIQAMGAALANPAQTARSLFDAVASGADHAEGGLHRMANTLATLGKGFVLFKAFEAFKGMADGAADVERLGTVVRMVGANAGYTAAEVDKADKRIQSLGITASASRQSLSQFIQAGLKVEDAARLARASQDLAVLSGENSSVTFQGLTQAIEEQSIMMLRWRGISVTNEEAQEKYAAAQGRSVSSLAEWEKKQALLNLTLERAGRLAGVYEAAMGDVGKQASSLARFQEEAANSLQEGMLPAYSKAVTELTVFLRNIKLLSDHDNLTGTFGKDFGDSVEGIARAVRGTLETVFEYRSELTELAKAYMAVKVAQQAVALGSKLASSAAIAPALAASPQPAAATPPVPLKPGASAPNLTAAHASTQLLASHALQARQEALKTSGVFSTVARSGTSLMAGAVRGVTSLASGLVGALGGLPGILITSVGYWLMFGDGMKTVSGAFDTLLTKAKNFRDALKGAFSGDEGVRSEMDTRIKARTKEFEQREKDRAEANSPAAKKHLEAVKKQMQAEDEAKHLEYQAAKMAEQLKSSPSQADQQRSMEIYAKIQEKKADAKTAAEEAAQVAKESGLSKRVVDSNTTMADRDAYEKGVKHRELQEAQDLMKARENTGMTKFVFSLGAPVTTEFTQNLTGLQKEMAALQKGAQGSDANIARVAMAYTKFVDSAASIEEVIVAQQEYRKAIDDTARSISVLEQLQAGATDASEGASDREKAAFESVKKEVDKEVKESGKDLDVVLRERIKKAKSLKEGFEGFDDPTKAMTGNLTKVFMDDKFGEQFYASMVKSGQVSSEVAQRIAEIKDPELQLAAKLEVARVEAQALKDQFASLGTTFQQLQAEEAVFKGHEEALQGVTKKTERYVAALQKVVSMLEVAQEMGATREKSSAFSAEGPSTLAAARQLANTQEAHERQAAQINLTAARRRQQAAVDYAMALASADTVRDNKLNDFDKQAAESRKAWEKQNLATDQSSGRGANNFTPVTQSASEVLSKAEADMRALQVRMSGEKGLPGEGKGAAFELLKIRRELLEISQKEEKLGATASKDDKEKLSEHRLELQHQRELLELRRMSPEAQAQRFKALGEEKGKLDWDAANADLSPEALTKLEERRRKVKDLLSVKDDSDYKGQLRDLVPDDVAEFERISARMRAAKEQLKAEGETSQKDRRNLSAAADSTHGDAYAVAHEAYQAKLAAIDGEAAEQRVRVTKETYAKMTQVLDQYVSGYNAKMSAIRDLHKGTLATNSAMAQLGFSDTAVYQAFTRNTSQAGINQSELMASREKVGTATATFGEDMSHIENHYNKRKELARNSGADEKTVQEQLKQIESDTATQRLEANKRYFDSLMSLRQQAAEKAKQLASEAVEHERRAQETALQGNRTLRSMGREGMTGRAAYEDKKAEYGDLMGMAERAKQAGDLKQAESLFQQAQQAGQGLANSDGVDKTTARKDAMDAYARATQSLVGIQNQQAQVARAAAVEQLALMEQLTGALQGLAVEMQGLSADSEIKLNVSADEQAIKEIQAQLAGVFADNEEAISVVLDQHSLEGVRAQVSDVLNSEPFQIVVEAIVRASDGSFSSGGDNPPPVRRASGGLIPALVSAGEYKVPASVVNHYGVETFDAINNMRFPAYADGGVIQGPGTGTSDSIPMMLDQGSYIIKYDAVQHYGNGFLNLLNSKSLRFAEGGEVIKEKKRSLLERIFGGGSDRTQGGQKAQASDAGSALGGMAGEAARKLSDRRKALEEAANYASGGVVALAGGGNPRKRKKGADGKGSDTPPKENAVDMVGGLEGLRGQNKVDREIIDKAISGGPDAVDAAKRLFEDRARNSGASGLFSRYASGGVVDWLPKFLAPKRDTLSGIHTIGIRGATGGVDLPGGFVPSLVSAGEFHVPASVVEHYGSGVLDSINSMSFSRFADGGPVDSVRPLSMEGMGPTGDKMSTQEMINLSLKIGEHRASQVQGSRESVMGLVHALRDLGNVE